MNLKKELKALRDRYVHILKYLYPSKGSLGFTERNLSVNFAEAYRSCHPNACAWYEFHFGKKMHYDALLVDPDAKKIFLIEAKRFSNPDKTKEVDSDIQRISAFRENEEELRKRIRDYEEYAVCGIILGDVWTEDSFKSKIKESFEKENYLAQFGAEVLRSEKISLRNAEYYVQDFAGAIPENWRKDNNLQWFEQYYCLLAIVWEITQIAQRTKSRPKT